MTELSNAAITQRLADLDLVIPPVTKAGGNYQSVVVRNQFAFVAIQFPIRDQEYLFRGKLGDSVTTQQGYEALQLCAINVIGQIIEKIGFEKVLALNHLDIYYQAADGWDDAPLVANGASDLFVNVMKEPGHHTRAIVGVANLPRNFSVGLVSTFTLH